MLESWPREMVDFSLKDPPKCAACREDFSPGAFALRCERCGKFLCIRCFQEHACPVARKEREPA